MMDVCCTVMICLLVKALHLVLAKAAGAESASGVCVDEEKGADGEECVAVQSKG